MEINPYKTVALSLAAGLAVATAQASSVTVNNFSFESQAVSPGGALVTTPNGPTGWSGFRVGSGGNSDIGLGRPGTEFSVANPLAAPADGNNYLWLNDFNGDGSQFTGIYQDMGALLANTTYTLTIAIGNRGDTPPNGQATWSPGVISLVNGADNTGTVLATTTGLPGSVDSWQDFTVSFTTGASVAGDLSILLAVQDAPAIQADFDNVRLDATPVPEPSTYALVLGGLTLFPLVRRKLAAVS